MERISKQCKTGFISTFIWGFMAHGVMLTNKLSWHDDVYQWFELGATYESGRWMLERLKLWEEYLYGSTLYSMPLYNGTISILCIALIVALLIHLLEFKSQLGCVALAGIMVTFPVVTGMLGYMFTAPAYMFGLLLGVTGAYIICKYKKWYTYIAGLLLCACCVGTYQAFIPVIISIFVIYMLKCNIEYQDKDIQDIVKEIAYYVAACMGFMVLYFVINNQVLDYYDAELLGYNGINDMGSTSIWGYLERIVLAYKIFIKPDMTSSANMYPIGLSRCYKYVLIMLAVLMLYYLYKVYKKSVCSGIYVTVLFAVLPLATNFVYFMCDIDAVHTLTVYGKAFVLVYLLFLLEHLHIEEIKWKQYIAKVGFIFMFVMAVMYVRFDNMCYLKAEVSQTQAIQYLSTMVTRIKSIEGYKDDLPVVFVNGRDKRDVTITHLPHFDAINILPYDKNVYGLLNNYIWTVYMNNWVGFNPPILPEDVVNWREDVKDMPEYPDDGSIQIIDGMIVVKF